MKLGSGIGNHGNQEYLDTQFRKKIFQLFSNNNTLSFYSSKNN